MLAHLLARWRSQFHRSRIGRIDERHGPIGIVGSDTSDHPQREAADEYSQRFWGRAITVSTAPADKRGAHALFSARRGQVPLSR